MKNKIVVSGVGCGLVDNIYNNVSFSSDKFSTYLSRSTGDGGLVPGQLVFERDFEKFTDRDFPSTLNDIVEGRTADKTNIGGPGIVSMIHAAQLSDKDNSEFNFYGGRGNDADGDFIVSLLKKTPLNFSNLKVSKDATPSTSVLSDQHYDNGNGERIFVNTIGAAWDYKVRDLNDDFFASDIVVFGGTALVPQIHDGITGLLKKAKENNCITIVNTVFDFRNQALNPNIKWPLGESDESYKMIDLLLMDMEETLRMSGKDNYEEAIEFFKDSGVGAVIVTHGSENIKVYSNGKLFKEVDSYEMPISAVVSNELKIGKGIDGDTTGCGDNFVGGTIASIVSQLSDISNEQLNLIEAASWGVVSGGTTCFYMGGTYEEKIAGEKKKLIKPYYDLYSKQLVDLK